MRTAALIAAWALAALASSHPAAAEGFDPSAPRSGDVVTGSPLAPVTVVEYASLTCPHCARFQAEQLPAFLSGWVDTGKARLVFRHFPLDVAGLAGLMAVNCLPDDARKAAVTALYADAAWSKAEAPAIAAIEVVRGARAAEPIMQCMADRQKTEAAVAPALEARKAGVDGTPTFFVGTAKFAGFTKAEDLGRAVDDALAAEMAR